MSSRAAVILAGLAVPALMIAISQAAISTGLLDFAYLPAPLDVAAAVVDLLRSGELAQATMQTVATAAAAAVIATLAGAAAGLAIGLVPAVRRYGMASVDFLRTIPAVALVPVAVLTFGPVPAAEVVLAGYAALWPVVLHAAVGAASVHARHYDIARMLRFGRLTTVRKIVLPSAFPACLIGARLAATIALLVTLMAEILVYPRGLGGGLVQSMRALAPARMWAYALACGIVGFLLNAGLRRAARRIAPMLDIGVGNDEPVRAPPVRAVRGLLPIALLLIGWEFAGSARSLAFPPPTEWLRALGELHADGRLTPALVHTAATYAAGLIAAVAVGVVVGVLIGRFAAVDRAVSPSLDFIAAIPGAALVPVVVLALGPSALSGVAVVTLIVSWPIVLNAAAAMRWIPQVRVEMSRTLGLPAWRRWLTVILPSLTPHICLGVSVASSMAVVITLLVDILGTGTGVGRLLVESQQRFDAAAVWGLLLIVGSFGYAMSRLLSVLERRVSGSTPAFQPARASACRA